MQLTRFIGRRLARLPATLALGAVTALALVGGCDNDDDVAVNAPPAAQPASPSAAATSGEPQEAGQDQDAAQPAAAQVSAGGFAMPSAQQVKEGDNVRFTLAYPTGDRETSALLLEKTSPAQVRVGQPYAYEIRVTNLTKAPLASVAVVETTAPGLELESAVPAWMPLIDFDALAPQQGQGSPGAPQSQDSSRPLASKSGESGIEAAEEASQEVRAAAPSARSRQQEQQNEGEAAAKEASQEVRAAAPSARSGQQEQQNEGEAQPASASEGGAKGHSGQSTQPSNAGGGNAETQMVQWLIPELMPGETRTIRVMAIPHNEGALGSCLVARYQPTLCTAVAAVQPSLRLTKQQVAIEKDQSLAAAKADYSYLCDGFAYRYVVTNTGTGVAKNVVVEDPLDEGLVTADGKDSVSVNAGDLPANESKEFRVEIRPQQTGTFASRAIARSESDEAASQRVTTRVEEAELAVQVQAPEWTYPNQPITYRIQVTNNGKVPARNARLELAAPGLDEDAQNRKLGNIAPGESASTNVTIQPSGTDPVELQATAISVCARGEDAAQGSARTTIRTIPALLIEMVDEDPVRIGAETTYTINVKNQGTAAAKNVRLTGEFSPEFKFVEGSGQTEVKGSGQNVTFGAVESLAPEDVVTWRVRAQAAQPGDGRFRVEMQADNVNQRGLEIEPTSAIKAAPTSTGGGQQR